MYWRCRWEDECLIIGTPWFGFVWYEYSKLGYLDLCVRGFELYWSRNPEPTEGAEMFVHRFGMFTEAISSLEQIQSVSR